jgi:hypothetical protein
VPEFYRGLFGDSGYFSAFADVVSVAGALVSLYVLFTVRSIERRFVYRARLPEWIAALRSSTSRISALLQSFNENLEPLQDELAICISHLKSIRTRSSWRDRARIKVLLGQIEAGRGFALEKTQVRFIYTEMLVLLGDLENAANELRWGGDYGR